MIRVEARRRACVIQSCSGCSNDCRCGGLLLWCRPWYRGALAASAVESRLISHSAAGVGGDAGAVVPPLVSRCWCRLCVRDAVLGVRAALLRLRAAAPGRAADRRMCAAGSPGSPDGRRRAALSARGPDTLGPAAAAVPRAPAELHIRGAARCGRRHHGAVHPGAGARAARGDRAAHAGRRRVRSPTARCTPPPQPCRMSISPSRRQ